jgi:hypothetical protein
MKPPRPEMDAKWNLRHIYKIFVLQLFQRIEFRNRHKILRFLKPILHFCKIRNLHFLLSFKLNLDETAQKN